MTAHRALVHSGIAAALMLAATAACAGETVVALSPAEKAKLLDAAADRRSDAADEPAINGIGRRIHGEVGMMVGTNGARGVFGSAVAPLGQSGSVAVAFENSRFGH